MDSKKYFENFETLQKFVKQKEVGFLTVDILKCDEYDGVYLNIGIIFNTPKKLFQLDLQWISYGLDLYGENLVENYLYQFKGIKKILNYLKVKFEIYKIPILYQFDASQFPNPIKNADKKEVFKEAWLRFQKDYKSTLFLDSSLELIYHTENL